MKLAEGKTPREKKLKAATQEEISEMNIPRICLETLLESLTNLLKNYL